MSHWTKKLRAVRAFELEDSHLRRWRMGLVAIGLCAVLTSGCARDGKLAYLAHTSSSPNPLPPDSGKEPQPEEPLPPPPKEGPDPVPVTLMWAPPATNSDGTPLLDLAGYRVYRGARSRAYTAVRETTATTFTSEPLTAGTYYFVVTAYDAEGNESEYSAEVVTLLE